MRRVVIFIATVAVLAMAAGVFATTDIRNTKHNLASWSTNTYKSTNYNEVCVFCHTPHSASTWPLWNREDPTSGKFFFVYSSNRFDPHNYNFGFFGDQGAVVSVKRLILCFSCHQEANSWSSVQLRNKSNLKNNAAPQFNHNNFNSNSAMGYDLRDDHPGDFDYTAVQADAKFNSKLYDISTVAANLNDDVAKAFSASRYMNCGTCHDVHGKVDPSTNAVIPALLRRSNASSLLCFACHRK